MDIEQALLFLVVTLASFFSCVAIFSIAHKGDACLVVKLPGWDLAHYVPL
jgi:hypothetical protein